MVIHSGFVGARAGEQVKETDGSYRGNDRRLGYKVDDENVTRHKVQPFFSLREPDPNVPFIDEVEKLEGNGQQRNSEQVTQSSKVRNGTTVWIEFAKPHPVGPDERDVQEGGHLQDGD